MIVRHHVCEIVTKSMGGTPAQLRVDAPGNHCRDQITGLGRVKLVAAHDAEKADESPHPRMFKVLQDEFLRRRLKVLQIFLALR